MAYTPMSAFEIHGLSFWLHYFRFRLCYQLHGSQIRVQIVVSGCSALPVFY